MRLSTMAAVTAIVTVVAVAGCGGPSKTTAQSTSGAGSNTQQQAGTRTGQNFVRVYEALVHRPSSVPTLTGFVSTFNAWIAGQAKGKDQTDVKAAGFAADPAPSTPLSPQARMAAAAVALQYLGNATKYGPVDEGYLVAFRGEQLEFRCKSRGNPASDFCKGPYWQQWQHA